MGTSVETRGRSAIVVVTLAAAAACAGIACDGSLGPSASAGHESSTDGPTGSGASGGSGAAGGSDGPTGGNGGTGMTGGNPGGFGGEGTVGETTSLSQFGITWTFDKAITYGQFANGDYWVVGPATLVGIDPPSVDVGGRVKNGAELNPIAGFVDQGFDSAVATTDFDPSLNVALDVSTSNPLVLPPSSSLVSTISIDDEGHLPQLDTAAILTVLEEPAASGAFRPPYCGNDKAILFNAKQLDYSLLENLAPVDGTPTWSEAERLFERPWIDIPAGWGARETHPDQNMQDYGQGMSLDVGVGALMLQLDAPVAQKETLMVRFVQLGIDLYGVAKNGGDNNWYADGGHASGRKWPILFAGIVLGDAEMKNVAQSTIAFGEDRQTFYVESTSPGVIDYGYGGYVAGDVGMPEWGIRHWNDEPECSPDYGACHDNKSWTQGEGVGYRECCTTNSWYGFVLAAHIMNEKANAKALWSHDALFDYQDRFDVQAPLEYGGGSEPGGPSNDGFAGNMWAAYRPNYGPIWAP